MKRAFFGIVIVLCMLTQLSFVSASQKEYSPVVQNAETQTAYINQIVEKNGKIYIDADYIQWFEGEQANQKFREIEKDPDMTEAPDGYYIVNDDSKVRTLEVADDATVLMQIYNRTGNIDEADIVWNERIPLGKFVDILKDDSEWDLKDFPYHLIVKNGVVVQIVQQYIP
jgi:hypothetical protein